MRRDGIETKKKILTVCVRLFLEQGYKETSITQITENAGVTRGSFQNLFHTKDAVLMELVEAMFSGQFGAARSITDRHLPPVYAYAVETAIQLTLTELNERLREIYLEAYTLPDTAEYIHLHTTAELKQIFGESFPDYADSDFYEMEIGTAGLMRGYMARKCDIHFPLDRKLRRFLTAAMRVYRVPEEQQRQVLAFIQSLDIRRIAAEVMEKLFAVLEIKFDFKLSPNGEKEEAR
jgi:AcrR family transcriptional regulator